MDYIEKIIADFNRGLPRALARILTLIENRADGYEDILGKLYRIKSSPSYRIGITGPPGAGKSTLVDRIALHEKYLRREIGIVAVDPSSPFSGGAVLGDRVRMRDLAKRENIFIRSMASRGSFGGLSEATSDVMVAFEAFGKWLVIVETVGVGQVELDVVDTCDTVVVVLTPESGDTIQALKSGIIEIADVFAINKSDRDGAEIFAVELRSILDLKTKDERAWRVPVVPTVATTGEGIDGLVEAIESHREFIVESGRFESHRIEQIEHKINRIIASRIAKIVEERIDSGVDLSRLVQKVIDGSEDPYSIARELLLLKEIDL